MKKSFILFLSFLMSFNVICASAEEREPNEIVFYDTTTGDPFVYNNTISDTKDIDFFNIPFAYNIVVDGGHLEFSITNEDFKWFVMRRAEHDYCDIEVCLYDGTHLGDKNTLPIAEVYVIRIKFNR